MTVNHLPDTLVEIGLKSCVMISDFFCDIGLYPALRVLDLEQSSKTTDRDIAHICKCESLEILNLNGCFRISNSSIENITKSLPKLKELHLKDTKCNDNSLFYISCNLKNLTKLSLGGLQKVWQSDLSCKGLRCNIPSITSLSHLDLSNTSSCDDSVLCALQVCTNLSHLDIRGTNVKSSNIMPAECTVVCDKQQVSDSLYSGDTLPANDGDDEF